MLTYRPPTNCKASMLAMSDPIKRSDPDHFFAYFLYTAGEFLEVFAVRYNRFYFGALKLFTNDSNTLLISSVPRAGPQ